MIQKWAHSLGLGQPTGIDIPGEVGGLVPSPAWRNRLFRKKLTDRPWTPGDNINLAVGQGDLQADPLQMAVAYSAIANGGYVVTPARRPAGRRTRRAGCCRRSSPARAASSTSRAQTRVGDHGRAARRRQRPRRHVGAGVRRDSRSPSRARPEPPSGAPRATSPGTSWLAPYNDPRVVVAVTIERGGFGAEAAAPAARRILAAYFGIKGKKALGKAGSSPD